VPELPETETIAGDLHAAICGAGIVRVQVVRADVLRGAPSSGPVARRSVSRIDGPVFARRLTGQRIARVFRRAKSIVIAFENATQLVVTPRFTGALILSGSAVADAYACLRLEISDGRDLRYTDVRRLGTVAFLDAEAFAEWSGALGPEPLDPEFTVERFSGCLRGSKRAIKSVLMDQARLAGVGNIYANEALWRARIRPSRRASSLRVAEREALHRELTSVLREAVAARGTSFRDYRDAFGARGGFAAQLQAYGRGGEPCTRCGAALKTSHIIEGRATVWCATCQK